jgi:hypothetical protein
VAGRESVFSDPTVVDLASNHFVPVAENCSPLQSQQDAKGEFFRLVAEQGHYAGRTFPTNTRQGYYAFTPDGRLLTAANSRDPRAIEGMLRQALARWQALTAHSAQSATGSSTFGQADAITNGTRSDNPSSNGANHNGAGVAFSVEHYTPARPDFYPADGLVLRLAARDLPREADTRPDDWRKRAWNLDYAWFTREEARQLVPEGLTPGAQRDWPAAVVRRLALFHLRDFVRGEPSAWPEEALRNGSVISEVLSVRGGEVRLRLTGQIRLAYAMRWRRPNDGTQHVSECGYDATLAGEATWNTTEQRFTAFETAAAGPRWGTNQYNNRGDDLGPAPMGIALTLAGTEPKDRTPPHQGSHRAYWQPIQSI